MLNIGVSDVMTLMGAAVALVGGYAWARRERRVKHAPPLYEVPASVYLLLEQARTNLFKGSDSVRFTILAPDRRGGDGATLRPMARIGWGTPAQESKARFAPGEGVAGMAWLSDPDKLIRARMGPFNTREEARRMRRDKLGMSEATANLVSDEQLEARVVIALPLFGEGVRSGVLCIDCKDERLAPEGEHPLWQGLAMLAGDVAAELPVPWPPHLSVEEKERLPALVLAEYTLKVA